MIRAGLSYYYNCSNSIIIFLNSLVTYLHPGLVPGPVRFVLGGALPARGPRGPWSRGPSVGRGAGLGAAASPGLVGRHQVERRAWVQQVDAPALHGHGHGHDECGPGHHAGHRAPVHHAHVIRQPATGNALGSGRVKKGQRVKKVHR